MPDTTHVLSEAPALHLGPRPQAVPAARATPGWTVLPDCPIAAGVVVDLLALHPQFGVAILEIDPHWTPEAITLLHGSLGSRGFHHAFPGHLPIIHRRLRHEHVPMLRELIAESFLWQAPLSLAEEGDWVAELQATLAALPVHVPEDRQPASALPASVDPAPQPATSGKRSPPGHSGEPMPEAPPLAASPALEAAERARARLARGSQPPAGRQLAMVAAGVLGLAALGGLAVLRGTGAPEPPRLATPGEAPAPMRDLPDPASATPVVPPSAMDWPEPPPPVPMQEEAALPQQNPPEAAPEAGSGEANLPLPAEQTMLPATPAQLDPVDAPTALADLPADDPASTMPVPPAPAPRANPKPPLQRPSSAEREPTASTPFPAPPAAGTRAALKRGKPLLETATAQSPHAPEPVPPDPQPQAEAAPSAMLLGAGVDPRPHRRMQEQTETRRQQRAAAIAAPRLRRTEPAPR